MSVPYAGGCSCSCGALSIAAASDGITIPTSTRATGALRSSRGLASTMSANPPHPRRSR